MTKLLKKSLALVLTLALCLSAMACCFIVSAEGETTRTLTIELANETAPVAGDTVTLNVVGSWTDVAGAEFTVTGLEAYDLTLTPTNTEDEVLFEKADGTVKFVDGNNEALDAGVLFTISFVAATAGDYTAAFADAKVFCDVDENDVDVTATGITVTVAEVVTHEHEYTATVTTQPTKDAEGVMTYTCACGEGTYTEAIAKPVSLNSESSILNHALYLSEVVGDQIGVNRTVNANGVINRGYANYFLEVSYMKYGDGFTLVEDVKTFYPEDKAANSTAKVDYFVYKNIALSEMAKEYTCTLYCLDENGVVVAYQENVSSISSQALSYVKKYSTNKELVTACVDMMNYGKALQEYFAALNPGTAIDGAAFPTVGFEAYADSASDPSLVPELVNTTATKTKLVETTQLLAGNGTLEIASSNLIRATFRCGTYDPNLVTIVASYKSNSGSDIVSEEVTLASVPVSGTTYSYTFNQLSVYDVNEYVTFTLKYNDVPEYTFTYSIDSFVNANIGTAKYTAVLTNLELFSRAMRVYKGFE